MRLFYIAAYGPMSNLGTQYFYVVAVNFAEARDFVEPHLRDGFAIERIQEQTEPPPPIIRSQKILNSPHLLGPWWDLYHAPAVQPDATEGAEQARLF